MCLGHFSPNCVSGLPVFFPVIGCVVVFCCIVPPLSLSDQSFDGLVDPWYMLLSADGLLRYVFVCSLFDGIFQACGEMKPLRVMSIHKSVCVTSFNDVLTEARGNIYADSTLISYVIWSPSIKCFMALYIRLYFSFFFLVYLNFL